MQSVLALTPAQRAELFTAAAQAIGLAPTLIEKDFWVCWTLKHLFTLPGISEHLIFKGGTSLSKVWNAIQRFSEDIDVSLGRGWLGFGKEQDPEAATGNKRKRLLDDLKQACEQRIRDELLPALRERARDDLGPKGWTLEVSGDDSQTLILQYPAAQGAERYSAYLRPEVKIEGGARSDDWPAEARPMRTYVEDAFPSKVGDTGLTVRALSAERTFWEKATILHAEAHRDASSATPSRFSRHYADLAALADHEAGKQALVRDDLRARVVAHKTVFFRSGWARYETAKPGSFRLLPPDERIADLERDYRDMQEMYFGDPVPWRRIVERLKDLEGTVNKG